jgi:hypothetical protein
MNQPKSILVGKRGRDLVIKTTGPATVAICDGVKSAIRENECGIDRLYIDLSESEMLDSTFAGLLIAAVKQSPGPKLHLVNPADGALNALNRLHLLPLFTVCKKPPMEPEDFVRVDCRLRSNAETASIVVDAHQKLIDADERNAASCQAVVDMFQKE